MTEKRNRENYYILQITKYNVDDAKANKQTKNTESRLKTRRSFR